MEELRRAWSPAFCLSACLEGTEREPVHDRHMLHTGEFLYISMVQPSLNPLTAFQHFMQTPLLFFVHSE
jgi:hypothetical protein